MMPPRALGPGTKSVGEYAPRYKILWPPTLRTTRCYGRLPYELQTFHARRYLGRTGDSGANLGVLVEPPSNSRRNVRAVGTVQFLYRCCAMGTAGSRNDDDWWSSDNLRHGPPPCHHRIHLLLAS